MFSEMRNAVGIPKGEDILDHIHALPETEQRAAHDKIEAIEREAMKKQIPQAGLVTLMEYLDSKGIKKGICTSNFEYVSLFLLFLMCFSYCFALCYGHCSCMSSYRLDNAQVGRGDHGSLY